MKPRILPLALALVTTLALSSSAYADTVEACATASEEGQVLRDRGKLREARALLVKCAAEACPSVVRKDCAEWLDSVDRRMPSVTPRARDKDGQDQADVRVLADGELLAEKLDGRAIAIDPGPRRLRFEHKHFPPIEQTIVVREGEKARPIDVVFGPAPAPPPPPEPPGEVLHFPVGWWILVGVAGASVGMVGYFGFHAKEEVDEMRSTCAPNCDPDRVDAARREALIANISIGVGFAAMLGASAVFYMSLPKAKPAPTLKKAAGGPSTSVRIHAGPTSGVTLSGVF
jgi:hypothetical protein